MNFLPLTGWKVFCNFEMAGHPIAETDEQPTTDYRVVDWRYLQTMKIPVKQGRAFTSADEANAEGVAIVNQTLAQRYWPGQNPIGQQVKLIFPATRQLWDAEPRAGWLTIVGIAGDARDWAWGEPRVGQMYLPLEQDASRIMHLTIRSQGDPTKLTSDARRVVGILDANQPVTDVRSMDGYIAIAVAQKRLNMSLLAFLRGRGCATGVYRNLRSDGIRGGAANARNWNSAGDGSAADRCSAHDRTRRNETRGPRAWHGPDWFADRDEIFGKPALRN